MAKQNGKAVAAKVAIESNKADTRTPEQKAIDAVNARAKNADGSKAEFGAVRRGVVETIGSKKLVSTHRRQYVVIDGNKAEGYFTASQIDGHTNAILRFAAGAGVPGGYKLHMCKAEHADKLSALGIVVTMGKLH